MSPVRLVPLKVASIPEVVGECECELVTAGGHVLRVRGATVEHLATVLSALALRLLVNAVALGAGQPLFKRLKQRLSLNLEDVRTFRSGVVALTYTPRRAGNTSTAGA